MARKSIGTHDYKPLKKVGHQVKINLYLDDDTYSEVLHFTADHKIRRAEALRLLIEWGLTEYREDGYKG